MPRLAFRLLSIRSGASGLPLRGAGLPVPGSWSPS